MTQQAWGGVCGEQGAPEHIGVLSGLANSFSDHAALWPPLSGVTYRTFRRRPKGAPGPGPGEGGREGHRAALVAVSCRRLGGQRRRATQAPSVRVDSGPAAGPCPASSE